MNFDVIDDSDKERGMKQNITLTFAELQRVDTKLLYSTKTLFEFLLPVVSFLIQ